MYETTRRDTDNGYRPRNTHPHRNPTHHPVLSMSEQLTAEITFDHTDPYPERVKVWLENLLKLHYPKDQIQITWKHPI